MIPEQKPKNKYKEPMSLWLVEKNHLLIVEEKFILKVET
jgi:hypothetical protein